MRKTNLRRYYSYLNAYHQQILLAILLGVINSIASVLLTYQIGQAVDQMVGAGQVNFAGLFHILGLIAGIVLVMVISQWFIQRLSNDVAYRSVTDLRQAAFYQLNHLPLKYYDQTPHGSIASRFTNDMDNIAVATAAVLNQLFSGITMIVVAFGFMLYLSPLLTLVVLGATPLIFFVNWLVAKQSQATFREQQQIVGDLTSFVNERVGEQKLVQSFQQEAVNQRLFHQLNQELYTKGQKAQFASSLTNPSARFVDHLTYVAIGLIGAWLALTGTHGVTIGVISSFTIYASQFSKPFIELSGIATQIQTALIGLERSFALLDQQPEISEKEKPIFQQGSGQVRFEKVSFAYQADQPLINNLSFEVQPGETVAIVGKTGAGKSTLVNLLMRFYEVDSGRILLDQQPIQDYQRDSVRQQFGMVLQDTWLFEASLRDNLRYGNPTASDEEIYQALEKTDMYEFVRRLPAGLDTKIGGQALSISDGQRQLLTIARTMLSHPHLLILDEATSSVDTLTEKKIQSAFLALMAERTSFVIAHRLATIKHAQKILVMDQGAIVEMGTHEELLAKKDGYYHQLYFAQFQE